VAVPDGAGWLLPKKKLVGELQVLLQSRRLRVVRLLPDAAALVGELEALRVKVTVSAHETFEAWRERDHDDFVLAVAMAAWVGERGLAALINSTCGESDCDRVQLLPGRPSPRPPGLDLASRVRTPGG
jgi:hypothetical protein